MLFKRFTLFHFFGFEVKADATWAFLSLFLFWTFATNLFPYTFPKLSVEVYQYMAAFAVLGLMISIVAHEVAHAIIAEYYHMPISHITLFIFGGVAEMNGEPSHPKGEFLMAIAGPAMSALMGLFFYAVSDLYAALFHAGPVSMTLGYLGLLNIQIAYFNMIPAFPLDGGRALRALIWKYSNNFVLATRISSGLGGVFGYGLLALASFYIVYQDNLVAGVWTGILGLFVHAAGTYAVRQSESRSLLRLETVSRFLQNNIVTVSPDMTIMQLIDGYVYKHYQKSFPVIDRDKLAGVIYLQSVLSLDRHKWNWLHVASVMHPLSENNTVSSDFNAADALDMMQRLHIETLMITDNGVFKGVVNYRDLIAYLSITVKIDQDKPLELSR